MGSRRGVPAVGFAGRALWAAVFLLAAGSAPAQESLEGRVRKAEDAARANAASAAGKDWKQRHSAAAGRAMIPVLNRCLPDAPAEDDIPTVFSVYVRLSARGRASEVLTELDAELGRCMTEAAREVAFPEAPRDDYWVQLNMAAPL